METSLFAVDAVHFWASDWLDMLLLIGHLNVCKNHEINISEIVDVVKWDIQITNCTQTYLYKTHHCLWVFSQYTHTWLRKPPGVCNGQHFGLSCVARERNSLLYTVYHVVVNESDTLYGHHHHHYANRRTHTMENSTVWDLMAKCLCIQVFNMLTDAVGIIFN